MEYGKVLRRGWRIAWGYRVLWVFGVLVALFGGNWREGQQGTQYTFDSYDLSRLPVLGPVVVGFAVLVVLALTVAAILLGYTARGALIHSANEVEESGTTTARTGWRVGWSHFLRLFAIDLVVFVPLIVFAAFLLGVSAAPLLLIGSGLRMPSALGLALTVPMLLLAGSALLLVAAVVSYCRKLVFRVCVLEDKGVFDSIREGYVMARQNLRQGGLLWLLMLGVTVAFRLIMVPVGALVLSLVVAPVAGFSAVTRTPALLVLAIPFGLLGILALSFVGGIYEAFDSSVWTLAYRELSPPIAEDLEPAVP